MCISSSFATTFSEVAFHSMSGHIIVCGDDALGMRIIEELNTTGTKVVTVQSPASLAEAEVAGALAVICAGDDDALHLDIALLARQAHPEARGGARLPHSVLRQA